MSETTNTAVRRAATRLGITLAAAGAAAIALPGAAQAHVTVQPEQVDGGGFSVVAFRVPTERDDASTTRLQVILPEDQPIGSVRTTPLPGWRIKTETRHLAKPIELFGEKLSDVVSKVTWTATDGGVGPGQFQDFALSLGPLPESGEMAFRALQTYSSGEQVNWTEVSLDKSVEPEHPAPALTITAAKSDDAAEQTAAEADGTDPATPTGIAPAAVETSDTGSETGLPIGLSAAALVVSLGAVLLAWRRGRA